MYELRFHNITQLKAFYVGTEPQVLLVQWNWNVIK